VEAHPEFDNAICASQMAVYSGFSNEYTLI
jgi:hypothetical protein